MKNPGLGCTILSNAKENQARRGLKLLQGIDPQYRRISLELSCRRLKIFIVLDAVRSGQAFLLSFLLTQNVKMFSDSIGSVYVCDFVQVLFHLGDLDEALVYALRSGDLFDVSGDSEFANTLRAKCIDEYSKFQLQLDSGET